jgi:DNA invertase Pin-like site-specific DNA recombinase
MRAAIYARFSTDRQNETSIEAQERLCRTRAATLGANVVAVHADQAISGSVPVDLRPGGKALLADVLAGRVDVVLVESLSRLSRDIGEQDRAVKRIEHRSVRIVGVSDAYDSLAASRKVLRVARGLVNELYLDDLRA